MGLLPELTRIKAVIAWGDFVIPEDIAKDSRVYTFRQFLDLGKSIPDSVIETTMAKQRPGHCVVLVYTSGTTGNPKGVMLSHDNLLFSMASCTGDVLESVPEEKMMKVEDQRMVSYLPLSHIAGLSFDITANMIFGSTLYFAQPDALQGTLVETLTWARPTMFLAVPRVWEKFEDKLKEITASKPSIL